MKLVLERNPKQCPETSITVGGTVLLLCPPVSESFWMFRVAVSDSGQAIVGFPKFMTIAIGFQREIEWNVNLPYDCTAADICGHISHNMGERIPPRRVLAAVRMVQAAAADYMQKDRPP